MAPLILVTALGLIVVALAVVVLVNRRRITRLERRVRALGVVDEIIDRHTHRPRPKPRHLRRIKLFVWICLLAGAAPAQFGYVGDHLLDLVAG
ncbi:MAG: hypothetical protein ACREKH_15360 [Candidatus Rokuibacteriota bacterium]